MFLVIFVQIERRVDRPLIRLELFSNRIFAISAVVTVIGMFAYLGTAYDTSIRLSAIQGYTPLKTSIGFFCLNVMGVVLFPVSTRMIERFNPGWVLAAGMSMIGVGDLILAAIPATNLSIAAVAVPLLVIGAGFKLSVTSITVVAVNSVPTDKAGMASGATSMLRDFGLTLGPAIVGAIALTKAADTINAKIAASPTLQSALNSFYASPAHVPAAQKATVEAAVGAVKSGPLGPERRSGPGPRPRREADPVQPVEGHRVPRPVPRVRDRLPGLRIAALVAALLAAVLLGGQKHHDAFLDADAKLVH